MVVLHNSPLPHSLFLANLGKGYLELPASDLSCLWGDEISFHHLQVCVDISP